MRDNSISRTFEKTDDSMAKRPVTETTINRLAEIEAAYSPFYELDDDIQRVLDSLEGGN